MPHKGTVNNPHGRPKGSPNKSTREIREALSRVIDGEIKLLKKTLAKMDTEKRMEILIKLLPFCVPKINPIDIDLEPSESQQQTPFQSLEMDRLQKVVQAEEDKRINDSNNGETSIYSPKKMVRSRK